jgi:hypothetical protein
MSKKRTNEEFLNEVKQIYPAYDILSEYINCDTSVYCHCNIHNVDFNSIPYNLLKGKAGCELCRREKIGNANRKNIDKYLSELHNLKPHLVLIGAYTDANTKTLFHCNKHNIDFQKTPWKALHQHGCPQCTKENQYRVNKKTQQDFIVQMQDVNNNIEVVGEYCGAHERVEVRCLLCGHIWRPQASSLVSGFGCPMCASSHGEKRIKEFLEYRNICFMPQKAFVGLYGVGNGSLSYDFYLPDYNLLIEYQGEFHDGTAWQQTESEFLVQKEHDKRKSQYAVKHNINLLEIWYWDYDDIDTILQNTINNLENSVETTAS